MNKQDFISRLRKGLSGLPENDIEERVTFYDEMIDDRIEEGMSEEDAVSCIGEIDAIIQQIIADTPITKLIKERIRPKRKLSAFEIVLLILGSPIWISVLAALFAVFLAVYVTLWCCIIALWAVCLSLTVCSAALTAGGIILAVRDSVLTGIAVAGAGLFCAGISVFMFFGCRIMTGAILKLTKKLLLGVKNNFIKKEAA